MNQTDLINGLFELVGGLAICINIYRLWCDKHIAGVHWGSTLFFSTWGFWNLYFYPANHLYLSFFGGAFLVLSNATWLGLLMCYNTSTQSAPRDRVVIVPKENERINT